MASSSVSKEKKGHASKEKKAQAPAEDSSAFGPIAERFRRAGDLDRAISLCREGLQKFPDRISARVTLGWALLELGKYDEAQAELEQVLRQRPDNLAAIRALAELHDRAEQTLNLPMDGPGQWPPSADAVDEVAGSMVADSFLALSADGDEDPASGAVPAFHAAAQPAVVPPAELGLAMWSALPATEPEPEPVQEFPGRTLFVGNDGNPIVTAEPEAPPVMDARAEPASAQASGVSDADLAALLAEADSLDALADVTAAPAVAFQAMAEAADADAIDALEALAVDALLTPVAEQAYETSAITPDLEPALVLDDGQGLPELEELTWDAPAQVAMSNVAATHEPAVHEAAVEVQVAVEPEVQLEAEPGFQLESLSVGAVEAMACETELAVEPESFVVDPDLQPILRFDLEPVVEPVVEPIVEPVVQPVAEFVPPQTLVELQEPVIAMSEQVAESVVIAQTHARIAAVVSMARATETRKEIAPGKTQVQALEHFLACVHARRRRVLTESVA